MTGEIVESRPGGTLLAAAFAILALLLGGLLLAAPKKDAWPVAILPLGVAAGIWLARSRPVVFHIAETRLEFERPDSMYVEYESMARLAIRTANGGDSFPIQIHHAGGTTFIPEKLSVSSAELYEFLDARLPPFRPELLPESLVGFRLDQVAKFGDDRVHAFVGGPSTYSERSYRGVGAMLGFAVAAAVMGAVGTAADPKNEGWMGAGIGLAIFGAIVAFFVYLAGRPLDWSSKDRSGLVIGPTGIALVQGETKGKLRWDEVKAIEHPPVKRMGTSRTAESKHGVGILVDGAYIVIKDHYHRPAHEIAACLREYWNGGRPA